MDPVICTKTQMNNYQSFIDNVAVPAEIEAGVILNSENFKKNPGWNGSHNVTHGNRVYIIHDCRPRYTFLDTCMWGWWWSQPTVHHHHHYYHNSHIRPGHNRSREFDDDNSGAKILRGIIVIASVVAIYFTAKSLGYSLGQWNSASGKISDMRKIKTDFGYEELNKEAEEIIKVRSKILNEAKKRNCFNTIAAITGIASLSMIALGAAYAASGMVVAGTALGVTALIGCAFYNSYRDMIYSNTQRKNDAKVLDSKINNIKEYCLVVHEEQKFSSAEPPKYESIYPDIQQIRIEITNKYSEQNKWVKGYEPSAPIG